MNICHVIGRKQLVFNIEKGILYLYHKIKPF